METVLSVFRPSLCDLASATNFFFTKFDVRDIDGKLSYKSKFGASGLFGGVALFKGFKKILS